MCNIITYVIKWGGSNTLVPTSVTIIFKNNFEINPKIFKINFQNNPKILKISLKVILKSLKNPYNYLTI